LLGIIFVWPWIAIHVKRFHDADMTGWITIAMVVLAIVVSMIAGAILPGLFGVDTAALTEEMTREMEDIATSDDAGAMMGAIMDQTKKVAQAQLIPNILSTAVVTGVVGAVMGLFKTTPGDNQYGAPEGQMGGDTFA
jgi:uncharacterized membrane protein YhaH (DUF805 family)